jgi:hypothetical protein
MQFLHIDSPPHRTSPAAPVPAWSKILKLVVPTANPDFDELIKEVHHWWIEVNDEGQPQREIGFREQGEAIMAMPLGDNDGFWTDSQMTFDSKKCEAVGEAEFEGRWSEVERHFASKLQTSGASQKRADTP